MEKKTELLGMSAEELAQFLVSMGEPEYRGRQIYRWIYQKEVSSFDGMPDLPKDLRSRLKQLSVISMPRCNSERVSRDGTRKFLFEMTDRRQIEVVAIPQSRKAGGRYTLCISTQAGCPIGCSFCATGASGFKRNLKAYEIAGQVLTARRELAVRLKNLDHHLINSIVYMGMGEPLLNYDQVLKSVRLLNDSKGMNIGQRHITISTAGEVHGINKLAEENLQITLAVSLHAASNDLRDKLVPLNKKYPLEKLMEAVRGYIGKTNRRVTFEYIMLDAVNMAKKDADRLVKLVKPLLANINLIPYNETPGKPFKRPPAEKVNQFYDWVATGGVTVVLRSERGSDIEAACGQLCLKEELANKKPI